MKYCCPNSQRKGTAYFEFQKGKFKNKFWLDDSINVSMDNFDLFHLDKLIFKVIPTFDYCGITQVSHEDWNEIIAQARGTAAEPIISELMVWAEECFVTDDLFTILGM